MTEATIQESSAATEGAAARAWIEARALELGFDAVRFAAVPDDGDFPEAKRFRAWLAQGYDGEMAWLRRTADRRATARAIVADSRSVAVCVQRYPGDDPPPDGDVGRVARYARGRDYHNVLGKRLRKLLRALREHWPGRHFYGSVDTGAVLEKAWAVRAGLGWLGKNTMLIDPETGSYSLLAVVLLPIALPSDTEVFDQCGTCRLCLDSCPTGAFPEPYVLDARRCISYLTIEQRGDIPRELREPQGSWLFGCDVCQEVCPFNRTPTTRLDPAFGDESTALDEPLEAILTLDDDEAFESLASGRPLKRPGRDGLVRNGCIVAGNSGDRRFVPLLAHRLDDRSAVVRRHAAWALGQLGGDDARRALEVALDLEQDHATREEVRAALASSARI